jgi:hypothetical protein
MDGLCSRWMIFLHHLKGEKRVAKNDRIVCGRPDGKWVRKRSNSSKAFSVHYGQPEVVNAARQMVQKAGGGELTIKGNDEKIRSEDNTIAPGHEPFPPKDTEH